MLPEAIQTTLAQSWPDLIIYTAIAVVTLVGVFKCLIPLWRTTGALNRAVRKLQRDAGSGREKPVWQESHFVGRRLRGVWLRFLQNAEQLDRRGLPCNVEDYINDDTVTYGPGNATLSELIPSLLTSLGILGTFIGLMRGLTGLDMTDSVSLMNGIPVLLDGMKTAFATSVAGVSCSLIFNMLNRMAQGSSFRAIDDFVESFTQLAMQRPLDNDVQLICQNQDANNALYTVADTLSTQVAANIEQAVNRAMQPVTASLDQFLRASTRAQVEGVSTIVDRFVQQMNESLSRQLLELGRTMTEINRNQQGTLAAVEASITHADAITADAEKLHTLHGEIMAEFTRFSGELSAAREHDERFEHLSATVLKQLQDASLRQAASLETLRASHDQLLNVMNDFRRASESSLEGMRRATERDLTKGYQTFVAGAAESVNRTMEEFDRSMKTVLTTLGTQLEELPDNAAVVEKLGEMQRLCASMERELKRLSPAEKEDDA